MNLRYAWCELGFLFQIQVINYNNLDMGGSQSVEVPGGGVWENVNIEQKESFCYLFRNGGLPCPQGAGGLPRPTGNTGLKINHVTWKLASYWSIVNSDDTDLWLNHRPDSRPSLTSLWPSGIRGWTRITTPSRTCSRYQRKNTREIFFS